MDKIFEDIQGDGVKFGVLHEEEDPLNVILVAVG